MSDYEDYSDGDFDLDGWFYVEEGSHVADELAEHAIASPPPTQADEDAWDNWERFDYWYDIDSASDGADDENGERRINMGLQQRGKRKRKSATAKFTKKQKLSPGQEPFPPRAVSPTPTVLFIPQTERHRKLGTRMLDEDQKPFALEVQCKSPRYLDRENSGHLPSKAGRMRNESSDPITPVAEVEGDDMEAALMAALQNRLGGGGESQGLDPSMLLQYAMRMMSKTENSSDIAGELADDMLNRSGDDPLATGLASWLSEQGVQIPDDDQEQEQEWEDDDDNVEADQFSGKVPEPLETPVVASAHRLPRTPSSTETNSSTRKMHLKKPSKTTRIAEADITDEAVQSDGVSTMGKKNAQFRGGARKRKAAESDSDESTSAAKQVKRVAEQHDASIPSSRVRASTLSSARVMRSGRSSRR